MVGSSSSAHQAPQATTDPTVLAEIVALHAQIQDQDVILVEQAA